MHSTADDHPNEEVLDWWQVDQPRYEVTDAIKKAVAASKADGGALVGPYELQLAVVLDRYAHRRTVAANMVRDVAELAVGRVAEVEVLHERHTAALTAAHEAEVARLRTHIDGLVEQRDQLAAQVREGRSLSESRHGFEDKVVCTFHNGSPMSIWSPAQLEEVAYRVRVGGGDDDHAIHVRLGDDPKRDGKKAVQFTAHLPNPDLVSFDLSAPQRPGSRAVAPAAAGAVSWSQWWPSRTPLQKVLALGGGAVVGVPAVLLLFVALVMIVANAGGWLVGALS